MSLFYQIEALSGIEACTAVSNGPQEEVSINVAVYSCEVYIAGQKSSIAEVSNLLELFGNIYMPPLHPLPKTKAKLGYEELVKYNVH